MNISPYVRAARNFDITGIVGQWYVVQYYASSEELPLYSCMRAVFMQNALEVDMNFTYMFADDPLFEQLEGNITWTIPNPDTMAHWVHKEDTYEGIYNTYVLDSDYKDWTLLMHCAEKEESTRYLSALLLSRKPDLTINVISYLRDKLPKYGIDTEYLFPMDQKNCKPGIPRTLDPFARKLVIPGNENISSNGGGKKKHPLQRHHKKRRQERSEYY
ncbi:apolipoprotein D-like [Ctenocephalides felis]|uniref:apolipoprotein D-like n=1 Tax=Ctenocephalides felis TaxID=7515 RepID=UPI000E6E3BAA|nr:apolipoprotein D-like [Ctenocephalides felis]